jgi:RDD family
MMSARRRHGPIHTEDRVASPVEPDSDRLRDSFFRGIRALTLGFVHGERWRISLGPLTLHEFGEPESTPYGWRWRIGRGLLGACPGGTLSYEWRAGELTATVDGYWPALPSPLYRATQLPLHHLVTRLFLLQMRGRVPPPGSPGGAAQRLAAAALDLVLCGGATLLVPRGRRLRAFPIVAVGYHLTAWSLTGETLGGRLLGLRVVSIDGGPVSPAQAVVRLLVLPASLVRFQALHDRVALTEVVEGR